jgi:hypothetical protein
MDLRNSRFLKRVKSDIFCQIIIVICDTPGILPFMTRPQEAPERGLIRFNMALKIQYFFTPSEETLELATHSVASVDFFSYTV